MNDINIRSRLCRPSKGKAWERPHINIRGRFSGPSRGKVGRDSRNVRTLERPPWSRDRMPGTIKASCLTQLGGTPHAGQGKGQQLLAGMLLVGERSHQLVFMVKK